MWKKRDWNPSSKMLLPMALSRPRQHGKVSWIFEGAFKFFPPNHTFRIRFPILFERFMSSIKKYVHSITILIFTTHLHFTASSELCFCSSFCQVRDQSMYCYLSRSAQLLLDICWMPACTHFRLDRKETECRWRHQSEEHCALGEMFP